MTSLPLCTDGILQKIERHTLSDTTREVGGILVGVVANGLVEIRAALPALKATAEATHVTFTHEVWEEILTQVDRDYPDCRIVGWYHSHPGFGIFLSEYDKFIHANFFSDERMLALVVDPKGGQCGWFGWDDGAVQLFKTFPMLSQPTPTSLATAGSPAGGQRRGRIGNAVLLAGLAGVVGLGLGYGVAAAAGESSAPKPQAALPSNGAVSDATGPEINRGRQTPAPTAETQPPATGAAAGPMLFVYSIRPNDSFWSLAEFIYGHGSRYTEIQRDNPSLDPTQIPVGTEVVILLPSDRVRAYPAVPTS